MSRFLYMRYYTQNKLINLTIGVALICQDSQYKNVADISVRETDKKTNLLRTTSVYILHITCLAKGKSSLKI